MVPPYSHRVSRVRRYSGFSWLSSSFAYVTLTLFRWSSHTIQLDYLMPLCCPYPSGISTVVWPLPRSLATTDGISVDVFSSPYLDVSVQTVPHICLWIQHMLHGHDSMWVSPFRNLRINRLFAAPRSFSQLITSFFGSQCQGIRPAPFLA